mgnify:CR=1 FL=1
MFDLQNLDLIPLEDKQKHKKIIDYCKKHNVKKYIETGAYRGKTVEAIFMAKKLGNINVVDIFAIELSEQHANKLLKTYNSRYIDVHIHKGDTVKELPKVLQKITEPALFWLDAHYSGGDTDKDFQINFESLVASLNARIRNEEESLYHEYNEIKK